MVLALRNIYAILFKQKEYKNLPILVFYAYALVAVSLRLVCIIWQWAGITSLLNVDTVQQGAKLCVGIVQDWITLDLAIRIHLS